MKQREKPYKDKALENFRKRKAWAAHFQREFDKLIDDYLTSHPRTPTSFQQPSLTNDNSTPRLPIRDRIHH